MCDSENQRKLDFFKKKIQFSEQSLKTHSKQMSFSIATAAKLLKAESHSSIFSSRNVSHYLIILLPCKKVSLPTSYIYTHADKIT